MAGASGWVGTNNGGRLGDTRCLPSAGGGWRAGGGFGRHNHNGRAGGSGNGSGRGSGNGSECCRDADWPGRSRRCCYPDPGTGSAHCPRRWLGDALDIERDLRDCHNLWDEHWRAAFERDRRRWRGHYLDLRHGLGLDFRHRRGLDLRHGRGLDFRLGGLQDRVTFATMNVFGRTLSAAKGNGGGRTHHGDHHVAVLIGKPFKGGVVGGVEAGGGDYRATSIDAATGNAVAGGSGSVPFSETLSAMGKTLGVGCGVSGEVLDLNIRGGKVVAGALGG